MLEEEREPGTLPPGPLPRRAWSRRAPQAPRSRSASLPPRAALGNTTTTVREVVSAPAPSSAPETASFAHAAQPLTIHEIYTRSAPGVVQVTATSKVTTQPNPLLDPFGFNGPTTQTQQALGSGFVIDKAGHIVTNYHVVQGASRVEVSFSDNERKPATVVGRDPSTDIAVLQVKGLAARALTPLPLGNSDLVQVGDAVVAIGNPLGEDRSITSGIVSALQRQIFAPNGAPIDHVIQTDAALNHGNSGGPLLNTRGQVVGVNSQIQTANGGDGNIGIGFAIPIDTVKNVAAQLISKGSVEHAFLGVNVQAITPERREAVPASGATGPARRHRVQEQRRGRCRPARRDAAGDARRRHVAARRRHHRQARRRLRHVGRPAPLGDRRQEARPDRAARHLPRRQVQDLERQARAAAPLPDMLTAQVGPALLGACSRKAAGQRGPGA